MNVPFFDLRQQYAQIGDELRAATVSALESTQYILGPEVETLETEISERLDAAHAIGVSSGTDALLMSLMAIGVGPGDIVITPVYSFFATAGVVARLHATPAFVDIDPATYNLCPRALERWFETHPDDASRVKAIIPVHLYGQCADMAAISELADARGIPLIEDAAQAIGASYPGKAGPRMAGTLGMTGCFSFFPTKNLGGIGDGGLLTTEDAALAERLRRYRNHAMFPKYHHAELGGNFRLDAIQAAALRVKLRYLDEWNAARRRNAAFYDAHLSTGSITTPVPAYGTEHHVYNQYVIRVEDRRDALRDALQAEGIGCEVYYPLSFHEQECFQELGYEPGDFPEAELATREVLALPIYPELSEDQLAQVCSAINAFFG